MIFEQIKLSEQMDDVHKVYISLKKHYFISISLISYAKKTTFSCLYMSRRSYWIWFFCRLPMRLEKLQSIAVVFLYVSVVEFFQVWFLSLSSLRRAKFPRWNFSLSHSVVYQVCTFLVPNHKSRRINDEKMLIHRKW